MSHRPNARQRENARAAHARALSVALPGDVESRPRVPLTGYEDRYEITRDGYVYSRELGRFIQHAYYEGRRFIQFQVNGDLVQMGIKEAADASWAQAPGRLFAVDIPASSIAVRSRDEREAVAVALEGLAEEIRAGRVTCATHEILDETTVPEGWLDSPPYEARGLTELESARAREDPDNWDLAEYTVRDHLATARRREE